MIKDSLLGKEGVTIRNATITDQREYTNKIIDGVTYCQVGGIGLRGGDETGKPYNPGNFRRIVNY